MLGNNNNYGWILCSSKSFPGKFYYFNPQTRQAVWNLNDLEKHTLPQNYFHDKYNSYPEPDTPPMEADSSLWYKKETPLFSRPSIPSYGPVFPKQNLDYRNWTIPGPSGPPPMPMHFARPVEKPWDRCMYQSLENPFQVQNQRNMFVNPNRFEASTAVPKWGFQRNVPKPSIFDPDDYQPVNRNFTENQNLLKKPLLKHSMFQSRAATDSMNNSLYARHNIFNPKPRLVQSRSLESLTIPDENPIIRPRNLSSFVPKSLENLHDDSFRNIPNFEVGKPKKFGQQQTFSKHSFGDNKNYFVQNDTFQPRPYLRKRCVSEESVLDNPMDFKSLHNMYSDSVFNNRNSEISEPRHFIQPKESFGKNNETIGPILRKICTRNIPRFEVSKTNHYNHQKEVFDERNEKFQPRQTRKRCVSEESVLNDPLEHTDLRHLLLAKRKKSDGATENPGGKKIKTSYSMSNNEGNVPKKKVTFNLDMDDGDGTENCEETEANALITINDLRELGDNMNQDRWYIVADFDVLMEHFDFLNGYVQQDNTCVLLIPIAVRKAIEGICAGDSAGNRIVMAAARHVIRKIDGVPHINVQLCEEDTKPDSSMADSILQCCLQVLAESYHVILITENEDLYVEAEANGIYCFKIQEIKDGAEHKISFDTKKIARTKTSLEVKEDIPDSIPVNCFRKKLFEFDIENDENIKNERIFFRNSNVISNKAQNDNFNENNNLILFSDCNDQSKNNFAAKNSFDERNMENRRLFPQKSESNTKRDLKESYFENKNSFLFNDCTDTPKTSLPPKIVRPNESFCRNSDDSKISLLSHEIKKLNFDKKEIEFRKQRIFLNKYQGNDKHTALSINRYNLDDHLKKFCKDYKINEENFSLRFEEIICSFTQVMEETLTTVLQENNASVPNYTPPYTLMEAVECMRELYDEPEVKVVIEKFLYLLVKYFVSNGKLKSNIKASEFMMLLGCSVLVIKCLNNVLSSQYLVEAEACLLALTKEVCSDSMPSSPPAKPLCYEGSPENRANFVKSPTEIISYLQRHYPHWRHVHDNQNINNDKVERVEPKIIRSTGKKIKINNNKNISLIESEPKDKGNKDDFYDSQVYLYIKNFLYNLSVTFHNFHHFLNSVTELKDVTEKDKKKINYKAVMAQDCIDKIVDYLAGIIDREQAQSTKLNSKLSRSIKYRQIIEKYLEQARALQNLLKSYKI